MAKPDYLSQSDIHGIWEFRRTVPVRLRPFLKKTAFKKSLGSTNLNAVKPAYHQFAKEVEEQFQAAEAALAEGSTEPLVPALALDVGPIAKRHAEATLAEERAYRAETTRRALADKTAFWRGAIVPLPPAWKVIMLEGDRSRAAPSTEMALARMYALDAHDRVVALTAELEIEDTAALQGRYQELLPADAPLAALRALAEAEVRVLQALYKPSAIGATDHATIDGRRELRPPETATNPSPDTTSSSLATDASNPLMSIAIEKWIKTMVRESGWKPRYANENRQVALDFVQVIGDKPMRAYTRADGRIFKEVYELVPPSMDKRKNKLGVGVRNVRALAEAAQAQGYAPLHLNTLNQKFIRLGQFFRWARDQYSEDIVNPVDRLLRVSKQKRSAANKEKSPYTLDELRIVFNAPVFTGCKSTYHWKRPGDLIMRRSSRYWVPLIAAFSGMRLGEICQLRREDVRHHGDLHYFLLLSPPMRLKNEQSNRAVPIHPMLLRMGLLEFVATCEERLFPDVPIDVLDDDESPSSIFSKRYGEFLKALGIKRNKLDFHSLRHTFVKVAKSCGLAPESRERIIGHVLEGEAGRYGDDYHAEAEDMELLKVRAGEMAKFEYRGLELRHLMPDRAAAEDQARTGYNSKAHPNSVEPLR